MSKDCYIIRKLNTAGETESYVIETSLSDLCVTWWQHRELPIGFGCKWEFGFKSKEIKVFVDDIEKLENAIQTAYALYYQRKKIKANYNKNPRWKRLRVVVVETKITRSEYIIKAEDREAFEEYGNQAFNSNIHLDYKEETVKHYDKITSVKSTNLKEFKPKIIRASK